MFVKVDVTDKMLKIYNSVELKRVRFKMIRDFYIKDTFYFIFKYTN